MRGVRLWWNGMSWSGACRDEVILGTSRPRKAFLPWTTVPPLNFLYITLPVSDLGRTLSLWEDEGDTDRHWDTHQNPTFNFCCFIVVTIARKLSLQIVSRLRSFEDASHSLLMQRHNNFLCFTMTITRKVSSQIISRLRSFEACISCFTDAEAWYFYLRLSVQKYNQH